MKVTPPPELHVQPTSGTGVPSAPGGPLTDVVRNNDHVLQEVRPLPLPSDDEVNKDDSVSNIVRQHWALFWRNGREQRKYLRDILRDEGFARSVLTILFHIPAASSAFALYILLASHLGSVHDAGYAVAAFAGAYSVQVMMGPMLVRALGLQFLLGITSVLNIAAIANMLVIGWRLTVDPNNVSTLTMRSPAWRWALRLRRGLRSLLNRCIAGITGIATSGWRRPSRGVPPRTCRCTR